MPASMPTRLWSTCEQDPFKIHSYFIETVKLKREDCCVLVVVPCSLTATPFIHYKIL